MQIKQGDTIKNSIFSLVFLISSALSSFFLVPIITHSLGVEAYGYVGLGTTIIMAGQVFSAALTAMSTRFIVVAANQEDTNVSTVFNSVFFACVFLTIGAVVVFLFIVLVLDKISNISVQYLLQVKIMLIMMAGSYAANILSTPFIAAQHFENDLRSYYVMNSLSQLARVFFPLVIFSYVLPTIWMPYFASLIVDLVALVVYYRFYLNSRLKVEINPKLASLNNIKEILSSGLWVSINRAGALMLSSFSVYLCNVLVSPYSAGLYSSFVQVQSLFLALVNSLVSSFVPVILKSYASNDSSIFYTTIEKYMKIMSVIVSPAISIVLVFAVPFFSLWLGFSMEEHKFVIYLMLLTAGLSFPFEVMNQGLVAKNYMKKPAIITLILGLVNIFLAYILSIGFGWDLFGIVLAQMLANILRSWIVIPLSLGSGFTLQTRSLYKSSLMIIIVMVSCFILVLFFFYALPPINDWISLSLSIGGAVILVYGFDYFCLCRRFLRF